MELYLSKLNSVVEDGCVKYSLIIDFDNQVVMNEFIGQKISMQFLNEIRCPICGRIIEKTFLNGLCYVCSQTAPEAEPCVLHPELCLAHKGIARNMKVAEQICLSKQIVYLAISGGLKVGVTRISQMPTRWIDQGAIVAVPIAVTPNRYTAGLIECELKNISVR